MSRYECVDAQKAAGFPVGAACEAVEVSRSGFYDWKTRQAAPPTQRQLGEAALVALIRDIFDASDGNYGVPRIYKALRKAGLKVNKKRVERLMRRHGMAGRFRRRKLRTTIPGQEPFVIPDLVGRQFDPGAPDVAWCQDITYIPTGEGWLYLASVLDLGSRRLIGYSMADHMRTELVLDALTMALDARGGPRAVAGVIAHATGAASTLPTTTSTSAATARSGPRSAGPGCVGTTRSPSRSGNPSNANASKAASTRPEPKPGERSSPGSTGTTPTASTPPSATSHPPSGNSTTGKPHNHPSAKRGDAQCTPTCGRGSRRCPTGGR